MRSGCETTVTHTLQSIELAASEIVQAEIVSCAQPAKRLDYAVEAAVVDGCEGLA